MSLQKFLKYMYVNLWNAFLSILLCNHDLLLFSSSSDTLLPSLLFLYHGKKKVTLPENIVYHADDFS